jgi:hypothetical protein
MRRLVLIICLAMFSTLAVAAELQEKSVAFLKELGIDPTSQEVRLIVNDQVGKYSLDGIAAKRDEDGVKRFIATRNYIRKFKQNPKTPEPNDYWARYITPDEKALVAKQIVKELLDKK